jgi:alanyl-tRNA synthetase
MMEMKIPPTRRLFWEDPMCERFTSEVLAVEERGEEGARIALAGTAFYPEGGGQPADEGRLGEAEVTDVQEEAGVVWHLVDRPVKVGGELEGVIDWHRRWDHMQQHSGQHLLSRIVMRDFGAQTRGFHMGADEVTIDVTGELEPNQLSLAESRANALIDEDLPIAARLVGWDDPAVATARKKPPEGIEEVRLVEIAGLDTVPCGGTHVPSTGRIGGLHILSSGGRRVHGLQRIAFLCGGRLRRDYARLERLSSGLTLLLTTSPEQFAERFEDLQEQNRELKREVTELRSALVPLRALALLEAAERVGPARVVLARLDDLPAEALPALAADLAARPDVVVLLGAVLSGAGRLVFARGSDVPADMGALLKEVVRMLGGGGGGAPEHASGGGPQGEALDLALTTAFEQLRAVLIPTS